MSELMIRNTYSEVGTHKTAIDYISRSKSKNTRVAYEKDWNSFTTYCKDQGLVALPATVQAVGDYITDLANTGHKVSTIKRYVSSISQAHQTAGYESPTRTAYIRSLLKGISNELGTASHSKQAAVLNDLRKMLGTLRNRLIDVRDRALLTIGFAGAFRRSELVALNLEDIEVTQEGLVITIRRSKTDQEGAGRKIGIPYGSHLETCPVRAYLAWIEKSGIITGPVFRAIDNKGRLLDKRRDKNGRQYSERLSDKAVALVVKRCAKAANLDASLYAGHSLRSGFATTAGQKHVSERSIMKQTGHKSVMMVRRYIQEGTLFEDNAAAEVGL